MWRANFFSRVCAIFLAKRTIDRIFFVSPEYWFIRTNIPSTLIFQVFYAILNGVYISSNWCFELIGMYWWNPYKCNSKYSEARDFRSPSDVFFIVRRCNIFYRKSYTYMSRKSHGDIYIYIYTHMRISLLKFYFCGTETRSLLSKFQDRLQSI